MGFIESLTKQCKKMPLNKTKLYLEVEEEKNDLIANGFKVKIKNEFDLFEFELIFRGFLTKKKIDEAYLSFLNKNYDVLEYLNYEEKRKMFNYDIKEILDEAPCFYDKTSQVMIYIPFLEPFINKRYTEDYAILMLKQHYDYVKGYQGHVYDVTKLYGKDIYLTSFSSLDVVYEDQRHICFYFDQLCKVYIYSKESLKLLNQLCFVDETYQGLVDREEVREITKMIENYQYKECLDYLKEKSFIGEKTYKKIYRKYK